MQVSLQSRVWTSDPQTSSIIVTAAIALILSNTQSDLVEALAS